jgi:hypothetical protein
MEINLLRYSSQSKTTLGALLIDNKFECYTLEDTFRQVKIVNETRVSAGRYEIKLREFGGHYERYVKKYDGHKGMLWLQDVPNFTDILIHIGNESNDTSGCVLLGSTANNNKTSKGEITNSTDAYLDAYFKILNEGFGRGERVFITIHDLDLPFSH